MRLGGPTTGPRDHGGRMCGVLRPRVVYKRRVQGVSPPFLLALRQMNISTLLRLSLSPPAGSAATMAY